MARTEVSLGIFNTFFEVRNKFFFFICDEVSVIVMGEFLIGNLPFEELLELCSHTVFLSLNFFLEIFANVIMILTSRGDMIVIIIITMMTITLRMTPIWIIIISI